MKGRERMRRGHCFHEVGTGCEARVTVQASLVIILSPLLIDKVEPRLGLNAGWPSHGPCACRPEGRG